MHIAVLDTDDTQIDLIAAVLAADGHDCKRFGRADQLLASLQDQPCDMVIGEWAAGNLGKDIVDTLRSKTRPDLPVLVIAGSAAENDVAAAWKAGASDCIVKPLRRGELRTRVRALLKCAYPAQQAEEQLVFGSFVFALRSGRVSRDDMPIDVTQKEFDVALLLFRNLGRPLSRAYLAEAVWSREHDVPTRTIDTHISRVRTKLALHPENGYRLSPVYSFGYKLEQLR